MDDYDLPRIKEEPIIVPPKEEIGKFFEVLPNVKIGKDNRRIDEPKYKALVLFLASSGLGLGEALSLTKEDVVFRDRMVVPNNAHETSSTKNSWVTFYNEETEEYPTWLDDLEQEDKIFPRDVSVYDAFKIAEEATGFDITPQRLREWFCEEMGNLGVQDRYIDAFCGRVPKSVLARRYTDYAPHKLKAIYEKASLKVLS